jgi:class 3 adenylate cyclase
VSAPITATFMFTDLVGSTATASRLGPEATDELRKAHFAVLRSAVAATGGVEVKTTGDGLMLMFSSPSRALSCAAAIQQGIDRHNQRGAERLEVRIGLSMGEATEEDDDYYGDCVVEAARLCDKAAGGQILTTTVLRALVGRNSTHEFASVGELELKGIPDPVPVVEVRWEPEAASAEIPLPTRLMGAATEGLFGFFGRSDEVMAATDAAKRAKAEGHPEVVLLEGEPGIGKTSIAAQVARALHAEGATVLFGHCSEGLVVPYHPWVEALNHYVEHAPDDVLAAHVGAHGGALARVVPALARRVPEVARNGASADADGERYALLEAVHGLLADAARDHSVVVVLDDLHWADAATLQVLRHLLSGANPPPVLIIGTYRDTDLSRDHPLTPVLADLRRESTVTRLSVRGLDDQEMLALVEGAAGHELADDGIALAHTLYRETGGNPFFTGELLRHLYEIGAIVLGDDGRYTLSVDVHEVHLPGGVRDVVIRRVDRLGEDAARLLTLAAVIGRDFDLSVLSVIAEQSEDETLDVLERAVTASLVTEVGELPGRFRFEHALIQHTLYQDLSATRRQRLHQRIAQCLEAVAGEHAPPIAELAHHWLAATQPSDAAKAVEYARLAGNAALDALAPDDAIRWYTQALELQERLLADETSVRGDLLIGLGAAQRLAGIPAHRETLLEAAELAKRTDDTDRLARAALSLARGIETYVVDEEHLATFESALERVDRKSAEAARLLAALVCEMDPRETEAIEDRIQEAIAIARSIGDDETLLKVLTSVFEANTNPATLDSRQAVAREAVELADRLDDRLGAFQSRFQLVEVLMELGDVEASHQLLAEAFERATTLGLPYQRWQMLLDLGALAALHGDLDAAESFAEDALALANRAGIGDGFAVYGGQLFYIRLMQDRLDELVELFVEAVEATPTIEALRVGVVTMLLEIGDLAAARERFANERAHDFTYGKRTQWYLCMADMADAAVDLDDRDAAGTLFDRLRPYADRIAFVHAVPARLIARPLARVAGLLGRDDEAEQLFDLALAQSERLESPYWIGRTRLDRAELFLRDGTGDHERAEADIAEASRLAVECGAGALERRAVRLRARLADR